MNFLQRFIRHLHRFLFETRVACKSGIGRFSLFRGCMLDVRGCEMEVFYVLKVIELRSKLGNLLQVYFIFEFVEGFLKMRKFMGLLGSLKAFVKRDLFVQYFFHCEIVLLMKSRNETVDSLMLASEHRSPHLPRTLHVMRRWPDLSSIFVYLDLTSVWSSIGSSIWSPIWSPSRSNIHMRVGQMTSMMSMIMGLICWVVWVSWVDRVVWVRWVNGALWVRWVSGVIGMVIGRVVVLVA